MTVRGRLDPGLEKPEEEREQGWVIRHHETKGRNRTQPEARRRTSPTDVHFPRHIDRPALQSRSYGGQGRPDLRTTVRRLYECLKCPLWLIRDQNSIHQRGQTIDVGTMTSHPRTVLVELPLDKIVPLPQSGHQGLVVGGKEPHMLLLLTKLSFQTITLERLLVSKA